MCHVMGICMKIVNSIRGRRMFRAQLEENESDYEELLYHADVRWLSWSIFLQRFRDLLQECVPLTNHSSAIQTHQDIPAETVSKNNSVPVTTPSCHVRSTNQDTLYQAGPITSGHIYNLDMGWRNASRSVSQRRPASNDEEERILESVDNCSTGLRAKGPPC
ncbi:hypothetical protein TNCV_2626401 [Trichonephila clavipes]|uniref:Uncharacterized protein n=1 Tax=Trichonephila clavipes TaxID=2585209 RepID=A0A8X6W789_TRICX|nr:hypothetical protein TNCV_2626401 [Trichonephila clavipes]